VLENLWNDGMNGHTTTAQDAPDEKTSRPTCHSIPTWSPPTKLGPSLWTRSMS
jgi:hypothetical protein